MIKTHMHERSFVMMKPDTIQRGLIGEIISRFERKGLKIVAMKMVLPTVELAEKHYQQPEADALMLGERTIQSYVEKGLKPPSEDPMWIAQDIQKKLVKYVSAGPVVAMVIEGAHAIEHVRKIRGKTNPLAADMGSITADYTIDSYFIADAGERAIRNLVHASGSTAEAEREIDLWFRPEEICDFDLAIEKILYSTEWEQNN
jgi:nucleoside-diphosphate kinase